MFRVLVVCTANICRSPATATLLRRAFSAVHLDTHIAVTSAGVAATAGSPACDLSSALVGEFVARSYAGQVGTPPPAHPHGARRISPDMLAQSDLVLCLDRSHLAEVLPQFPQVQAKTFTLRQAARLSQVVAGYIAPGQKPPGSILMPTGVEERLRWWVSAMDSVRGQMPPVTGHSEASHRNPLSWSDHDVPDPHVLGYQVHGAAIELAEAAVGQIATVVDQVVAFGRDGAAGTATQDI